MGCIGEQFTENPDNAVADVSQTGLLTPDPTQMGIEQTGSWVSAGYRFTQGVSSQAKVFISGTNVIRNKETNQSSLKASLAVGTAQLIGNVSDSQNNVTNPSTGNFIWLSTNNYVCTVNSSGLCTFHHKGSVTVELRYSRQASANYANNAPSSTEAMAAYATCEIQVGL